MQAVTSMRSGPDADRHGVAGLRLDVGVLDEGGLEAAFGGGGAAAWPAATSPHLRLPRVRMLSVDVRVHRRGAICQRGRDAGDGLLGLPGDRQIGIRQSPPPPRAMPTSASTASPRKRTSPGASTGWSFIFGKMPNEFSPGTSLAVRIATSPGVRALTASRSPSVKRARACGERTTRIHSASAGASSAPNRSVPATFGQPSTRARRVPTVAFVGWVKRSADPTPLVLAACVGSSPALRRG